MHKKATIAALLAAGGLALSAPGALAQGPTTVTCGETITHSVKLANDLTNCSHHGLVVGADGITVDLNGHTISGTVAPTSCDFPGPDASSNGIQNAGHDGITAANGTIRRFDVGVAAGSDTEGMSDSRVHDLTLVDNRFNGVSIGSGAGTAATADNRIDHNVISSDAPCSGGVELNTGDRNRFTDNRVEKVGDIGIAICCDGTGNVVDGNSVSHTGHFGILLFFLDHARITDNALSDTGDDAIDVLADSPGTVVTGNTARHAIGAGVFLGSCGECGPDQFPTDAVVQRNTFNDMGLGIVAFEADRAQIVRNSVDGARGFPDCPVPCGEGVVIDGSSGVLVSRNTLANGHGVGVRVGLPPEFGPSSRPVTGNIVDRNMITGMGSDGINVQPTTRNTTLTRNTANHNGADGIHVLSPFTTLTRNEADRNALLGIEAVAGVTDGGGNEASGNGTSAQCTGVACK